MKKIKISIIVFFLSVILYCINLHYHFSNDLNIIFFWVSIVLMFGMVIFQIFFEKKNQYVLFEIFIIFFLLHLVYQLGYYGLRGSDSYRDFNFFKHIINKNNFTLGIDPISGWPMLHILSSEIYMITNVEPLIIAKFFPSFISSIIIIPLYLIVYNIHKDKRTALLTCLVFGTVPQFISFNALFVRETYGLYTLVLFFYVIYVINQRHDYRFKYFAIILIPAIVFSHHFSSFMLIILLTIYIIISKIVPRIYHKQEDHVINKVNISSYYVLLATAVFLYWIYITTFIFQDFSSIFKNLIGIQEFTTYAERIDLSLPIATLRGNIIYYGFFFINGIISIILLIKFILNKNKYIVEDLSFTLFFYLCLFIGFLSLFFLGSLIFPDRFIPFGFIVGLIPLITFLFIMKKNNYKRILFAIIIVFIIFNIYYIDPENYTGNADIDGSIATEIEYTIAKTIKIPQPYYGYVGVANAIYDVQGIEFFKGAKKNPLTTTDFFNVSNFAIINEGLYSRYLENTKIKSIDAYERIFNILKYKNYDNIEKICDLGEIYILVWKK